MVNKSRSGLVKRGPNALYMLMHYVRVCALAAVTFLVVLIACLQFNLTATPFYESAAYFVLAGALLYGALSCPGWWGSALSLSLTCVLFGLRLTAMWRMDKVNPHLVGGLLPYSDASAYYMEALRLLDIGYFSWATVNAGRPLWPGTIATVLSVTGGDLQIALALLTAIVACACYLFARETQLSFGTITGTIVFLLLYLFYVQFIGVTSSEVLGLALGAVAAGVLLRAVRVNSRVVFWIGLFLLGLALQARPGAFFILPALALWGMWSFGDGSRYRAAFIAGCCAAVGLGFAIRWLFMTVLVDETAPPAFTQIGLMLWSLAAGRSPDDIYLVHPEVRGLPPQQLNPLILNWAWTALWAQPLSIIGHAVRVTMTYFSPGGGAFDYLYTYPIPSVISALAKLNLLGWVGIVIRSRRSGYGLVGAAIVGIVVSVPLTHYVGSRSNAATIPLMIIPPALAMSWIIASLSPFRWIKLTAALRRRRQSRREQSFVSWTKWRLLVIPAGVTLLNLAVVAACFQHQPILYGVFLLAPLVIIGAMGLGIMMPGSTRNTDRSTIARKKARWHRTFHRPKATERSRSAVIYGLTLASIVIVGPFVIKSAHKTLSLPDYRCPATEVSAYLRVSPGSVVNVVEDGWLPRTQTPYVRNSDYGKLWGKTRDSLPPGFDKELLSIEPAHTLLQGIDLRTNGATGILWLNVPTRLLPRNPGVVRFCLPPSRYGVFLPSSAEMVSQGPWSYFDNGS